MIGISPSVAAWQYQVVATTIQSTICDPPTAPKLFVPSATTSAPSATVSGSTTPSSSVAISDNGTVLATVVSDSAGGYDAGVPLTVGANRLSATATNSCGTAASAAPLVVERRATNAAGTGTAASSASTSAGATSSASAPTSRATSSSRGTTISSQQKPAGTSSARPWYRRSLVWALMALIVAIAGTAWRLAVAKHRRREQP